MLNRTWDTRVVWLEAKQRWWWNAYLPERKELSGFADSEDDARRKMRQAIEQAEAMRRRGTGNAAP